ncbi:MAG TPA: hypothetical protein VK447_06690, partial [Myxococcaceae bacterium]|nr:hypothetical protein [Myxococcaceae bacterium]
MNALLPTPRRASALLAAVALLLAPSAADAGNDDPIPYPDEPGSLRELPRRSDAPSRLGMETEVEQKDREQSLAHLDDPNAGFATELLVGAMLIESSRGIWVEGRLGFGGRLTWELGRTFAADEFWREAVFLDLTYAYAQMRDGTALIFADSNYHYVTVAPALNLPFGRGSPYGFFAQVGAGATYQYSVLHSGTGTQETPVVGVKPLIQYGIGLRGAPRPWDSAPFRLSFRLELT